MNVILQPCGNPLARTNYAKTVEKPVRFAGVRVFASIEASLSSIYPGGVAPVWGITAGQNGRKIPLFKQIHPGDAVLFIKDNEIFSIGSVTFKTQSPQIADYLWGQESPGVSFEFLYFLDEVKPSAIPIPELNRAVGYKENNIIQGFSILDS